MNYKSILHKLISVYMYVVVKEVKEADNCHSSRYRHIGIYLSKGCKETFTALSQFLHYIHVAPITGNGILTFN